MYTWQQKTLCRCACRCQNWTYSTRCIVVSAQLMMVRATNAKVQISSSWLRLQVNWRKPFTTTRTPSHRARYVTSVISSQVWPGENKKYLLLNNGCCCGDQKSRASCDYRWSNRHNCSTPTLKVCWSSPGQTSHKAFIRKRLCIVGKTDALRKSGMQWIELPIRHPMKFACDWILSGPAGCQLTIDK